MPSQLNGTKTFQMEGVVFGWQMLSDIYQRECEHISKGCHGWYHNFTKVQTECLSSQDNAGIVFSLMVCLT